MTDAARRHKPRYVLARREAAESWWVGLPQIGFTARARREQLRMAGGRCAAYVSVSTVDRQDRRRSSRRPAYSAMAADRLSRDDPVTA